ncbi:ribosomal protein VAR1 (mitochondrion) [Eremothecium gossypii FDAG1]|uniref:ribosomal protein VAR1 n=1 Tax=Eremothecium gossypii (strain FDAG1) TaxID=1034331 RepID=UPI00024BB5E5|nr:ribosomal protein VAR1 [Eremothecium gossypii FDAG1]AEY99234.1 ribosomal protein VAR1 [Eremothecium gossypii FDAG1]
MKYNLLNNMKINNKKLKLKLILMMITMKRLNNMNQHNIYKNRYYNKNNNLQYLNKLNTYNNKMYYFNKQLMNNMLIIDNTFNNLLKKMMMSNNILMTNLKFEHRTESIHIKYYFYNYMNINNDELSKLYNNYMMSINNQMMNLLNNDNNSLNNLMTKYYNKKVYINTYKLNYMYLDTELLSQTLTNIYNNNGLTLKSLKMIINKLPFNNDMLLSKNYVNKMNKYNLTINNNLNNNKKDLINLYTLDNKLLDLSITNNMLLGKYLVGSNIQLKGRTLNRNITRTMKMNIMKGTFNNYMYQWSKLNNLYKLNYMSTNINKTNNTFINKNGMFNIKIKLNTI